MAKLEQTRITISIVDVTVMWSILPGSEAVLSLSELGSYSIRRRDFGGLANPSDLDFGFLRDYALKTVRVKLKD